MLTLFVTASAVLILVVIYQERKYKYFQEITLTIFREVCRKWQPTDPPFDIEHSKKAEFKTRTAKNKTKI